MNVFGESLSSVHDPTLTFPPPPLLIWQQTHLSQEGSGVFLAQYPSLSKTGHWSHHMTTLISSLLFPPIPTSSPLGLLCLSNTWTMPIRWTPQAS